MANLHLFMWTALDAKDDNSLIVLNKVCLIFKVLTNLYNSGQWLKICLCFKVLTNLYNSGAMAQNLSN